MGIYKKVIIRHTNNKNIEDIIKEAFNIFIDSNKIKNSSVIVKPNLGFKTDSKGGTTDIKIIENVLKILRINYKPKNIFLVESDGIAFRCEDVFEYLNIDKICAKYEVEFINLSKEPRAMIKNEKLKVLKKIEIPKLFLDNNITLINLAKIKTHEIARFSGAIKNLYGLNPYIFKVKYHPVIDDVLQDIYNIFKPDLNIVDGIWAINGHGPWMGEPIRLNTLIVSNDALLADIECLKMIGWETRDVPYIQYLKDSEGELKYAIDGELPKVEKFFWCKPSKTGQFKEKMGRILIPLLEKGFPLFSYSKGQIKIITYGDNGKYCKTIKTFPKIKNT